MELKSAEKREFALATHGIHQLTHQMVGASKERLKDLEEAGQAEVRKFVTLAREVIRKNGNDPEAIREVIGWIQPFARDVLRCRREDVENPEKVRDEVRVILMAIAMA